VGIWELKLQGSEGLCVMKEGNFRGEIQESKNI
jgi:hypothetical protein